MWFAILQAYQPAIPYKYEPPAFGGYDDPVFPFVRLIAFLFLAILGVFAIAYLIKASRSRKQ